ncbi:MAG: hypothetical protein ACYC1M_00390 [Armatimonadota bacterium]
MADNKTGNATPQTDAANADAQMDWNSIQEDLKQFEDQHKKKGGKRPASSSSGSKKAEPAAPSALSSVPVPVLIGVIVVALLALIIFFVMSSGSGGSSPSTSITPPQMGKPLSPGGMMNGATTTVGKAGSNSKLGPASVASPTRQPGIVRPGSATQSGAGQTGTWTGAGTLTEQERRKLAQQQKNQIAPTRTQNSRTTGFSTRTNQVRPKGRTNEGFGTDPESTVSDY